MLSQILPYPLPTPARVFRFLHDGGSPGLFCVCLPRFGFPVGDSANYKPNIWLLPFLQTQLTAGAQGHINPARCYIFCSQEGKCKSRNGQCLFLLGDRVGCLIPTKQPLPFFFFLDFVSIFAKRGDENINCEIWLQSSDMGVRSDLGDYRLVCGYTCHVVVKAMESNVSPGDLLNWHLGWLSDQWGCQVLQNRKEKNRQKSISRSLPLVPGTQLLTAL